MRCGKQLEEDEREFCHDCQARQFAYKRGIAAFSYSDVMKDSMYAFKYNNRREYAGYYSQCIVSTYGHIINSWKPQVLIPVPLHRSKQRKRGYNQAEVLAKGIGSLMKIPVDNGVITRVKRTTPQKELNDRERYNNLENAFQILPDSVKYKNIILVDDIYTTGATIDACARILAAYGAENIYFITACIGRGF